MHSYRRIPVLVVLVGAVCAAPTVDAQTTASTATPASDAGLAEIVVTAEKRSSTMQDTPISISALSGEQLQSQGIEGITGVVQSVPGLSMRTSGPGQTELDSQQRNPRYGRQASSSNLQQCLASNRGRGHDV
jgi:iron complex outermembrane recepter protein